MKDSEAGSGECSYLAAAGDGVRLGAGLGAGEGERLRARLVDGEGGRCPRGDWGCLSLWNL